MARWRDAASHSRGSQKEGFTTVSYATACAAGTSIHPPRNGSLSSNARGRSASARVASPPQGAAIVLQASRRSQPRRLAATEANGSHRGQGYRRYSGRGPAAAAHRPRVPGAASSLGRRAHADASHGMARPAIEGHGGIRQYPVDSHRIPSISIVQLLGGSYSAKAAAR